MSKTDNKIRIIDLLNKIANKESIPKRIKWTSHIYEYDFEEGLGYVRMDFNVREYLTDDLSLDTFEDLNDEVEILEDNTEDIEELPELADCEERNMKINELVKAVNGIRKDLNK